ncbi:LLM class flavin-dependent oxidoreductase [Fuscibacter oryzae]|uniref:LLM class flavin-dependent oxidoreductase n=1 Tax=Fuscibacter oryzae TaxID=2803939 RepID=A0A8J7SSC6_9RHOB|nr:LLM class flavin-dependent oxidoreductase [Fuscibacter oryzae]MBL4926642.1 LLM class flavin-dependent oxidoreductase [Fuscibacter oryzae]
MTHFSHIGFLIPGNFAEEDPLTGLEQTLDLIAEGEVLGYDSAWVRQRHLERGISSAATFLAAATQRTKTIGLGTAVIPLGYENPFRLAEDLATVDVLSKGRLNVGVSANPPQFGDLLGDLLYDGHPSLIDFGHGRAERLARALRSEPMSDQAVAGNAAGAQVPRLQPVAKGLTNRLWYGGGSLKSAEWAGRNGWHMLTGNIVTGEATDDFRAAQGGLIDRFLASWQGAVGPRIALGRVILPLDGASPAQRRRYRDYVASRHARTLGPQGPKRTLFAPDIIGTLDEILDHLSHDPIAQRVSEFRLELPYEFPHDDYAQIVRDFARILPRLRAAPLRQTGS